MSATAKAIDSQMSLRFFAFISELAEYATVNEVLGQLQAEVCPLNCDDSIQTKLTQDAADVVIVEVDDSKRYQKVINKIREQEISPSVVCLLGEDHKNMVIDIYSEYDVDDVVVLPMPADRLYLCLEAAFYRHKKVEKLNCAAKSASNTAKTAMQAASEIGLVMRLFEGLAQVNTYEELSKATFKVCESLGLNAVMEIIDNEDQHFFPPEELSASVKQVLTNAYMSECRIVSQKRLMLIRTEYLVLMITNAPWEDEARYGRYRDLIAQIATMAESKARDIMVNSLVDKQHKKVESIMNVMKMLSIDTHENTRRIMQQLSEDLEFAALSLDLELTQEQHLLQLSDRALDNLESLSDINMALEQHFEGLINSFSSIKELFTQGDALDSSEAIDNDNEDDDGVELF